MTKAQKAERYTCSGSVRGCCGVRHRTIGAAVRCVARDQDRCASLGGGAYSDRAVWTADADGWPADYVTRVERDDDGRACAGPEVSS